MWQPLYRKGPFPASSPSPPLYLEGSAHSSPDESSMGSLGYVMLGLYAVWLSLSERVFLRLLERFSQCLAY